MDTNLVSAIAEAMRQIPAVKSCISDTTWQMLLTAIIAIVGTINLWKSHQTKTVADQTKTVTDRIEKDVNSTALALAEEKKRTQETVLLLSQQKAAQEEKIRGMENVKAAASLPPGVVVQAVSPSFSEEQIAQIVKALKG